MRTRVTSALTRAAVFVLVMLISGCAPGAPSGSSTFVDVQAFGTDFVRQVMAALLL
jgi:hypothetical protein